MGDKGQAREKFPSSSSWQRKKKRNKLIKRQELDQIDFLSSSKWLPVSSRKKMRN